MRLASRVRFARKLGGGLLPEQVTIKDQVKVKDASGGTTTTFVNRAAPVRGQLFAPRDVESAAVAGQVENRAAVGLALPYGTVVDEGARVQINGKLWVVVALLTVPSATTARVRVLLREV